MAKSTYGYITVNNNRFEKLAEGLDLSQKDLQNLACDALVEAHKRANVEIKKAMKPHMRPASKRSTGRTMESLLEPDVGLLTFDGYKYRVPVGFNISDGGLASIFLMYGTPKQDPDNELRDAIVGKKAVNICRKAANEAMEKLIKERFRGN